MMRRVIAKLVRITTMKNPVRYHYYRWGSGRNQNFDQLWGKCRGKR
jgi:hypothetical protein